MRREECTPFSIGRAWDRGSYTSVVAASGHGERVESQFPLGTAVLGMEDTHVYHLHTSLACSLWPSSPRSPLQCSVAHSSAASLQVSPAPNILKHMSLWGHFIFKPQEGLGDPAGSKVPAGNTCEDQKVRIPKPMSMQGGVAHMEYE